MKERIAEGIVDVFGRIGEARGNYRGGDDSTLQRESAAVISRAFERPHKKKRPDDMEERQQANPQRVVGIPHVFSAADQIVACDEAPCGVKIPQHIGED